MLAGTAHLRVCLSLGVGSFLVRALDLCVAALRNVDNIVPWALGGPGVSREAAPHQKEVPSASQEA